MKYIIRFEDTGRYACKPYVTPLGLAAYESDDRSEAYVFLTLRGAWEIVTCLSNTGAYIVPLESECAST